MRSVMVSEVIGVSSVSDIEDVSIRHSVRVEVVRDGRGYS